jgi:hypothetical protein
MKKREGYTKQGVRDLNSLPAPKRKIVKIPPDCDHVKMRVHCRAKGKPCGHLICDGCGLFWDPLDGAW